MIKRPTWMNAHRALGDAILSLARAEFALVFDQWKRWAFEVAKLLALVFVSLLIFVYLPFLVMLAAVDGVAQASGWSYWLAALAVLGLALLVIGILGAIGFWLVKRRIAPDNPAATFQRRLDDHRGWWRHQVFEEPGSENSHQPRGDA